MAIRSWMFVPGACYKKGQLPAMPLSDDEMEVLKLCDGKQDITPNEVITGLLEKGIIEECDFGNSPSEWSGYRAYPHRHFPKMNIMLTGKCNYNCLHCFNAADNAPLMTEIGYSDAISIIDQAADCGIVGITITGGEPMLHPHFMDIVRHIHEKNMFVEELNTNGYFITKEVLEKLRSFGCMPLMKISFDGIGFHDWMRNRPGAQEHTLGAIKTCIDCGFEVMVQMQVNKRNEDVLYESAKLLNEMGVQKLRMIRTTEVPRWHEAAGDACIPIEDYYDYMPRLAKKLADHISSLPKDKQHLKKLIIWQLLTVYLSEGSYIIYPVKYGKGECQDTYPTCHGNRGMVGVTSAGDVVPCLQMSGTLMERGDFLGNLYDTPLSELLAEGPYLDMITKNLYQLKELSAKCRDCRFFSYCGGGCRALAYLYGSDSNKYWGEDPLKCRFFNEGYYERTVEAMGDMTNLRPLGDEL